MRSSTTSAIETSQAEALVRSARVFLFDTVELLWRKVLDGRDATIEDRAAIRLATCHAVASAVQAVDLVHLTGGATSLYTTSPMERAFRDVHAITQHVAVHPRVIETAGRILFGLEPDIPAVLV